MTILRADFKWIVNFVGLASLLAIYGGCGHAPNGPSRSNPTPAATKPVFPELPPPRAINRGVDLYEMQISGTGPGLPIALWIYLPAGRHERKSLPCVFIAPAGAAMWGMAFVEGDRLEHVPYARVGFAVVAYEVSGGVPQPKAHTHKYAELTGPMTKFMEAEGGMVNARVAIDFALQKIPEVDPNQLFACGHSSAAIQALDLAAIDPRIRACCAYAPCTDFAKQWSSSKLSQLIPGFSEFAKRDAPMSHVGDFNCPVFLFHADDDENPNCSLPDNQAFADAMRAANKDITFRRVATGGHYTSMIKQGIPAGIDFLRAHGAKPLPPIDETHASANESTPKPKKRG
jgi:acetyl esterase/lipase